MLNINKTKNLILFAILSFSINGYAEVEDSSDFNSDSILEENFNQENFGHPLGIDESEFNNIAEIPDDGNDGTDPVSCGARPNPPAPGPSTGFFVFQVRQNNYYDRLADWIECNDNN